MEPTNTVTETIYRWYGGKWVLLRRDRTPPYPKTRSLPWHNP
ncbi:hypothetical protein [Allocoleopsis franciscana]|nr:hypothetical protein [Allocoleopsis franciscana]